MIIKILYWVGVFPFVFFCMVFICGLCIEIGRAVGAIK